MLKLNNNNKTNGKKEWTVVKIPVGSKTHKKIIQGGHTAAWKTIEEIVENQPESKEDRAIKIYNKFIEELEELYPNKKDEIRMITPFFRKRIFGSKKIDDEYFDDLKDY